MYGAQTPPAALPARRRQCVAKPSFDEQVETLKKLKDLLDMGVLTQEEFDAKKREVLAL